MLTREMAYYRFRKYLKTTQAVEVKASAFELIRQICIDTSCIAICSAVFKFLMLFLLDSMFIIFINIQTLFPHLQYCFKIRLECVLSGIITV